MRSRNILKKTLWLTAVLALLCAMAFAAMAEHPLDKAKHSEFITAQENVWVDIPADSKAASWDVSLWKIGPVWERLFYRDNVTAAGKVTFETKGKLPAGVYALRVVQYDAKDEIQTDWQSMVTVFDALPTSGVTLTLSNTTGSTGASIGASVYAPGATSGLLVYAGDNRPFKGDAYSAQIGFRQEGKTSIYAIVSYKDGSTRTSAKQTVTVSDSGGKLGSWSVTGMPEGKIDPGSAISLHLSPVENTAKITSDGKTNIYYDVNIWDTDEDELVLYQSYRYKKDPGDRNTVKLIGSGVDVKLPAGTLKAGHNYVCFINVSAYGYTDDYRSTYFTAKDAEDAKLTLTINGKKASPLKMSCGEEFTVKVNLPKDATAMRVYCGDHFEYMNYWGEWEDRWQRAGAVDFGWSVWNATQYPFYAQAYYEAIPEGTDLEELKWGSAVSNVIAVSAEDNVYMPVPTVTLEKAQVTRGDVVVATVTDLGDEAEGVNAFVTSMDTGEEFYDFHMTGNTIRIPTAAMAPGTYTVRAESYAQGRWGNSGYAMFTVAEPAASDKPLLSLGATEIPTHEEIRVQAYAEGAKRMDIYLYRQNGDFEDHRDYDGDFMDDRFGFGDPGTYTVVAVADYGNRKEETRKTFKVKADKGKLKLTTIDSAPQTLKVGEDATITFTADSKAGWVWLGLHQVDDGWHYIDSMDVDAASGSATFDGGLFSEPGTYVIRVDANQENYASSHLNWYIRVVKAEKKPTLSLTVNGGTKPVTVKSSEGYYVEVQAPGATALRVLNDNGDWEYRLSDDRPQQFRERWDSGDSRSFTLVAEACYDKYNLDKYRDMPEKLKWSAVSNEVRVTVTADSGRLDYPEASLSAASVNQGGKLTVTVKPLKITGTTPEYWVNIQRKASEDDYPHLFHMDLGTAAGTVTLPTNILEPGEYRAEVGARAAGFESSVVYLPFTVKKASSQKKVQAMASKTKVKAWEEVLITATAIGADRTEFVITREGDKDWDDERGEDGESVRDGFRFDEKGTYYVTPVGHYGKKEEKGDKITITVTSTGTLKEAKLSFPGIIMLGKPFEGTFKAVSGAEGYWVDVDWSPEGEDWHNVDNYDIPDGVKKVSLSASTFDRPGRYSVQLNAYAMGKGVSHARHFFAVIDPDKVLVLPKKLTKIGEEAFKGVDAQLIVVPKGVKSIDSRAFADCKNLLAVVIPSSVEKVAEDAFEGCSDGLIRAKSY